MARPQFVGRTKAKGVKTASDVNVSLTSLTGGLASAPADGDLIVVGYAFGSRSDVNLSFAIRDAASNVYTVVGTDLYGNDTYDTNLVVAYKHAGATPDTQVNITTGMTDAGYTIMVEVWRGVDSTTVLDVAAVGATGTNTGRPNPGSITPSTALAEVLCFAAGASVDGSTPSALTSSGFTSIDYDQQAGATGQASISSAFGHYDWTSGAFDAAQFGGGSTSTSNSWAAMVLALRPQANAYSLTVGAGAFILSGATASLLAARKIVAAAGSFTLTGASAGLLRGLRFIVDAGSFTLTGASAAFVYGRRIVADAASFTLAGANAGLLAARKITAGAGSFALTGADVTFSVARKLVAGAAAFIVTAGTTFLRVPPPYDRTSTGTQDDRDSRSDVQYRTSESEPPEGSRSAVQFRSSTSSSQDRSSR